MECVSGSTKIGPLAGTLTRKIILKYLLVDLKIRRFLEPKLKEAMLSHIDIERIKGTITVSVFVARPGVVIGQDGSNIKALKTALLKLIGADDIKLTIVEIKNPDLDAQLVAQVYRQAARGACFLPCRSEESSSERPQGWCQRLQDHGQRPCRRR
jgi:ribosomal protein S3